MSQPLLVDWYDYPTYYDALFRDETGPEADFLEQVFVRYAGGPVRRVFEPGCGSGRLIVEMARRGYDVTGLDNNDKALAYVASKLQRHKLTAALMEGDMAAFALSAPMDAAFCTFNTFRHLLTKTEARGHLQAVARCLKAGGVYVLGLHLLPLDVDETCTERWSAQAGRQHVTGTLRVLSMDRRRRVERIRLSVRVRGQGKDLKLRTEFSLRLYHRKQILQLLKQVPELEHVATFDFWYDVNSPLPLDDEITDTVLILRKSSRQ